jgi:hypothetical protein
LQPIHNDSNAIAESFRPAQFGEVAIENVDPQLQLTSLLIKMTGLAIPNQTWKEASKESHKKEVIATNSQKHKIQAFKPHSHHSALKTYIASLELG